MDLKDMYMVREHFKAGGLFYEAGRVLTPQEVEKIPLLKIRLGERKLVRLDIAQVEIVNLCAWIAARYGVDAKAKLREALTSMRADADPKGSKNPPPGTPSTPDGATK